MTNPWEGIARPESSATFNREIVDDVQIKTFEGSRDSLNQCALAIFYEEN